MLHSRRCQPAKPPARGVLPQAARTGDLNSVLLAMQSGSVGLRGRLRLGNTEMRQNGGKHAFQLAHVLLQLAHVLLQLAHVLLQLAHVLLQLAHVLLQLAHVLLQLAHVLLHAMHGFLGAIHGFAHLEVLFSASVQPGKHAQFLKLGRQVFDLKHRDLVGFKEQCHLIICQNNATNVNRFIQASITKKNYHSGP